MCLSPTLIDGKEVRCRKCWQCRNDRVDDLVGRAIAESLSSLSTVVMTLTYGRDEANRVQHPKAAKLEYRDVQALLKRLRFAGYPCRYLAAGEYGGDRGRAHWHVVLFWQKKVPWLPPLEVREDWVVVDPDTGEVLLDKKGKPRLFWPHGYVWVDKPEFGALKYALKYALKDESNSMRENAFGRSTSPPLGVYHFQERAEKMVRQGLAPQSPFYTFPDVKKRKGQERRFRLSGRALDIFILHWMAGWSSLRAGERFPPSPFLEEWQDANARRKAPARLDKFGQGRKKKEKSGGYISSAQLDGKEKQWLIAVESDDALKRLKQPPVKPVETPMRRGETYSEWRIRTLREARLSSTGRLNSAKR